MSSSTTSPLLVDQLSLSSWLTPVRCRMILLLVLAAGVVWHVQYLNHNCPIDLGGDEAQYWDWSRHPDLSYYSKGPAIAYIIRASCAIFGDTMQAVRYPAVVFAAATTLVTYLLTVELFESEQLALGTVLLLQLLPVFIVGSVFTTIDPPMFFCWALATYFAVIAIFKNRKWAWICVGIAIGLGFLAKYSTILWFVGLFAYLLHSRGRKSAEALIALIVACLFTLPVILWNARHNWVSLHHIAKQTGASEGGFSLMDIGIFVGGQLIVVGPLFVLIMIPAIRYVVRKNLSGDDPYREKLILLLWIGLAFLSLNFIVSLRAKVQPNWPAPAYFTLLVVTAYYLGTRLQSHSMWKPTRGWFWGTIVIGVILLPIAHDTAIVYPILKPVARLTHRDVGELDPLERVRGWARLGLNVSARLQEVQTGAFILCDDYQQTAEMAFYVADHPTTYCAGSYIGKRMSQYDIWQGRVLEAGSTLAGHDAVYVGKGDRVPPAILAAFERIEMQPSLDIEVAGVKIRSFKTWRCFGFKGLQRSTEPAEY